MSVYPIPMRRISSGVYEFGYLGDDPVYRVERVLDQGRPVWQALERVGSSWSWVSTRPRMRDAVADLDMRSGRSPR